MGSMWLSRAVYRKFMAVYGCEGESICSLPKHTVLFGSPGECTENLWQSNAGLFSLFVYRESRAGYGSLGESLGSLGLSKAANGKCTAV